MITGHRGIRIDSESTPQGYAIKNSRESLIGYITVNQDGEQIVAFLPGARMNFNEVQQLADIVKKKFFVAITEPVENQKASRIEMVHS